MNAAHASKSAAALTSMFIHVSFLEIDVFCVRGGILEVPRAIFSDVHGNFEQFRAQRETRVLRAREIHVEANAVSIEDETDHPAALGKTWDVAHGQDARLIEGHEDFFEVVLFGRTDEENAAAIDFLRL